MSRWSALSQFASGKGRARCRRRTAGTVAAVVVLGWGLAACGSDGSAAMNPSTADAVKRLTEIGIVDGSGAASVLPAADIIHSGNVDQDKLKSEGLTSDQYEHLKLDFCTYAWGTGKDVASALGLDKQLYLAPTAIAANWVGAEDGADLELYCEYGDTPGATNSSHEVELAVSTADHQEYNGRIAVRYTEKLSDLTLTVSSDDGSKVDSAKLAPFAATARQRMTVGQLPGAAATSASPTAAAVGSDRVSWSADGAMTKDAWNVTSTQGTSLWIPYDNVGGKPQDTTLVLDGTRELLPEARFTFPDGGGCLLSLHDIPNDEQAGATSGSLTYGCVPPGTYVLVSAVGSQNSVNGTTAGSDERHYATLTVNSNNAWKGVCMVYGDASVYNVPSC